MPEDQKFALDPMTELVVSVRSLTSTVGKFEGSVKEMKELVEKKYVTREAFLPVKLIAYGLVGLLLMAMVGAVAKMVLK